MIGAAGVNEEPPQVTQRPGGGDQTNGARYGGCPKQEFPPLFGTGSAPLIREHSRHTRALERRKNQRTSKGRHPLSSQSPEPELAAAGGGQKIIEGSRHVMTGP